MSWELADAVRKANHVYLCGNGGSAANALHIANDWLACGIKAHALVADVATLTAIANDFGYEHVFSRQLETLLEAGDLVIVLSGSGNSLNILEALKMADTKGVRSWAIVGGGKAAERLDHVYLTVREMQGAEQEQLKIGHAVAHIIQAGPASVRGERRRAV